MSSSSGMFPGTREMTSFHSKAVWLKSRVKMELIENTQNLE